METTVAKQRQRQSMLRLILSISGVGLIVLGVFGGQPLDNLYNRFAAQPDSSAAVEVPAVEVPAVAETSTTVVAETNSQPDIEQPAAIEQTTVEQTSVEQASVEQSPVDTETTAAVETDDKEVAPEISAATDASDTEQQIASEDTSLIAIGDEVIAEAADQAPASQLSSEGVAVAITDEQKASARNDQVELATTILTGAAQTDASGEETDSKTEDVEQLLAAGSVQGERDVLVVVKDKVNLRQGPSIDHPVVLQLQQGQELMEFKREGRWVHVGAYGTSGKIGWVHQRLVGPSE